MRIQKRMSCLGRASCDLGEPVLGRVLEILVLDYVNVCGLLFVWDFLIGRLFFCDFQDFQSDLSFVYDFQDFLRDHPFAYDFPDFSGDRPSVCEFQGFWSDRPFVCGFQDSLNGYPFVSDFLDGFDVGDLFGHHFWIVPAPLKDPVVGVLGSLFFA